MTPPEMLRVRRRVVEVETRSAIETQSFAAALATVAQPGDRLALIGPLGAGKTQFAKGFARGLGIQAVVNSPSFTLMAEYDGRLPLFHQDLYRLAGTGEALEGGLLDERQNGGVTLSEWAERLDADLDHERLDVRIDLTGDETRRIAIVAPAPGTDGSAGKQDYEAYLDTARTWRP